MGDAQITATSSPSHQTTAGSRRYLGKAIVGLLRRTISWDCCPLFRRLGQPLKLIATNQFIGTYHVLRPQRSGRESIIRISADQSLAFDSNTTYYRWELNGDKLDAYYMYQPDDPSGDYSLLAHARSSIRGSRGGGFLLHQFKLGLLRRRGGPLMVRLISICMNSGVIGGVKSSTS